MCAICQLNIYIYRIPRQGFNGVICINVLFYRADSRR